MLSACDYCSHDRDSGMLVPVADKNLFKVFQTGHKYSKYESNNKKKKLY